MRVAIIAGLMAVGLLAGCGSEEDASIPESASFHSGAETPVEAKGMTPCQRICTDISIHCIQDAHQDPRKENACELAWGDCMHECTLSD